MKTNSHWLLNTIRVVLAIFWYLNIALIVIAFSMLTIKCFTSQYTVFSHPVQYASKPQPVNLVSLTSYAKDVTITNDQGTINMQFKNTPLTVSLAYFLLISLETLATTILYQLRKFFDTLKDNIPFQNDNIKRLKIIALCFTLLTPLHMLLGISKAIILKSQVKDFNLYHIVWDESFTGLMLGAVIYVMADVFKYGLMLKKENEEFV
jgi:hypothetical protein